MRPFQNRAKQELLNYVYVCAYGGLQGHHSLINHGILWGWNHINY